MKDKLIDFGLCLLLGVLLVWLTGCTAIREHPRLAAAAAGVVVTATQLPQAAAPTTLPP